MIRLKGRSRSYRPWPLNYRQFSNIYKNDLIHNKLLYKYYFETYFFITLFDYVCQIYKEKMDTLIDFCVLGRVRVYTKKLVKAPTFFLKIYLLDCLLFLLSFIVWLSERMDLRRVDLTINSYNTYFQHISSLIVDHWVNPRNFLLPPWMVQTFLYVQDYKHTYID